MVKFLILLIFVLLGLTSVSKAGIDDGVDHVAVAKVLIRDGFVERASSSLSKVNPEKDDVEWGMYWLVKGLIDLHQKKYESSIGWLKKALKETKEEEVNLYLSEAYFQKKDLKAAEATIQSIKSIRNSAYFVLKSSIYWEFGQKEAAWKVLSVAEEKGIAPSLVIKKKFSLLLRESLFYAASQLITDRLSELRANDVTAMAQQLRLKKQALMSRRLLEAARLKWPRDERLNMELAANYIESKEMFIAALLVEELSRHHNHLSHQAADLLAATDQSYRAELLNPATEDMSTRLKQRLSLYLQGEKYDHIAQMEPLLNQASLLQKEDIRYAVAYSLFKSGRFSKAQTHLSRLTRNDLFEKAVELREEIEKCQKNRWLCRATL